MVPDYPDNPLRILLFDDSDKYRQSLSAALSIGKLMALIQGAETVDGFRDTLAGAWDVILAAYPVASHVLSIIHASALDIPFVLLCEPEEQEWAFALTDECISDVLPRNWMNRLPFILRRELKLKNCKRAEAALHISEIRYRTIVEEQTELVCRYDSNLRLTFVNRAYAETYGMLSQDMLGMSILEMIPPADHEATLAYINSVTFSHPVASSEHQAVMPDQTIRWFRWTDRAFFDQAGNLIEYQGVRRDVTEQKHAETTLLEHEQQMRLFVEHSPAAIAMLDKEMKYLLVSRRWLANYRLSDEQVIGRSHYDLFPDTPERWRVIYQRCLTGAVEKREADPFPRADGTLDWVRWEIHPWQNRCGEVGGLVLLSEVITARKQAEEAEHEQRRLAEALRDSLAVLTTSLDVETVMQQILAYSARVIPSDAGAILLFEGNQGRVAYSRGHSPEAEVFFKDNLILLDDGVYKKNSDNQIYYLAADTRSTSGWITFPVTAWVRSSIGVQIALHGEPIGLLIADSATPNRFQQKDAENLQAFARYAALALENAHRVNYLAQRVQERTAELEAAKTQVEAILDNSPDGILLIQADLTIQQANRSFHQLFHCEPNDFRGQSVFALIHAEDANRLLQLIQTVRSTEQRRRIEVRAVSKEQTIFDAEFSVAPSKKEEFVCIIRDITDRKAQERWLCYHASLQENVSDAVIVTDLLFHIQSWNRAAERIYGWSAAEVIGKAIADIVHTEFSSSAELDHYVQQLREQGWWQGEVVQHHKDGTVCHILGSITVMKDEKGLPISVIAVNRDISERKQMEDILRESEARYRLLAENLTDVILKTDITGTVTFITPSCVALSGYLPEEFVGSFAGDFVHPEDLPRSQLVMAQAITATETAYSDTYRLRHKAGHYVWVEARISIVRDPSRGTLIEQISVVRDITERKRTEEALRESEERFRQIAENFDHMLFIRSGDNQTMVYINPAAERLTGMSSARMYENSHAFLELVHPDDLNYVRQQQLTPRYVEEGLADFEYRFIRPDQQIRWVRMRAFPIKDENGVIIRRVGISEDVTERKQSEAILQQALTKEKELGELKSRFVSMASHEFRTPLTTILLATETLSIYRHRLSDAQIEEKFNKIKEQIGHLKDITEDILMLARMQAQHVEFNPVLLDLDALCRTVIEELQSHPHVKHRLKYSCSANAQPVILDRKLMRQILSNLVSNAIKYSPAAKLVTIALEFTDAAIILKVCDEGIGIPAADLPHLFEPFHRAANVGTISGTGLGLVITKQSVELQGGAIAVESQPGVGTTFTIHIPTQHAS